VFDFCVVLFVVIPGDDRIQPVAGFYSPNEKDPFVYECDDPTKEKCIGGRGGSCGLGYTGLLCSQCDKNYYPVSGVCLPCTSKINDETQNSFSSASSSSSSSVLLTTFFTSLFFGGLGICMMFCSDRTIDRLAYLVIGAQRTLVSGESILMFFDQRERVGYNYLRIIRLDFSILLSQCQPSPYTFVDQYFISISVLGIIFVYFIFAALIYQYRKQKKKSIHSTSALKIQPSTSSFTYPRTLTLLNSSFHSILNYFDQIDWFHSPSHPRVVKSLIFIFSITSVELLILSFTVLNCGEYPIYSAIFPGISALRLRVDHTSICFKSAHIGASFLALFFLLCYVGFPLYFLYRLYMGYRMNLLTLPDFKGNWSLLYGEMKPQFFWYRSLTWIFQTVTAIQFVLIRPNVVTQLTISMATIAVQANLLLIVKENIFQNRA